MAAGWLDVEWHEYGRLRHGINDGEMRMLSTWVNDAISASASAESDADEPAASSVAGTGQQQGGATGSGI